MVGLKSLSYDIPSTLSEDSVIFLSTLSNLQVLSIRIPRVFDKDADPESGDTDNNYAACPEYQSLSALHRLDALRLCECGIDSDALAMIFESSTQLSALQLNDLPHLHRLGVMAELQMLTYLNLSRCPIDDEGVRPITALQHLITLDIVSSEEKDKKEQSSENRSSRRGAVEAEENTRSKNNSRS